MEGTTIAEGRKTAATGLLDLKEKNKKVALLATSAVLAQSELSKGHVRSVKTANNGPSKAHRGKEMPRVVNVRPKN